jgi:hypothetical protein
MFQLQLNLTPGEKVLGSHNYMGQTTWEDVAKAGGFSLGELTLNHTYFIRVDCTSEEWVNESKPWTQSCGWYDIDWVDPGLHVDIENVATIDADTVTIIKNGRPACSPTKRRAVVVFRDTTEVLYVEKPVGSSGGDQ